MKKFLLILLVIALALFAYFKCFRKKADHGPAPVPIAVSKHSDGFNQSVDIVLNDYYGLADGFVNWDSAAVSTKATALQKALHDFKIDELKKDSIIHETAIYPWENAKNNIGTILGAPTWEDKRRGFKDLSDNLQQLLVTIKYDKAKVYWQECPMAFGEGQAANWLSKTEEVVNPYLGNKNPQFGNSMLHCGETKMTIDFVKADSTKNQ